MNFHDKTLLHLADPQTQETLLGEALRHNLWEATHAGEESPETLDLKVDAYDLTPELAPDLWLDATFEVTLSWQRPDQDTQTQPFSLACVILGPEDTWRDALRQATRLRTLLPEETFLVWLTPAERFDDDGWPGAQGLATSSRQRRQLARLASATRWLLPTRRVLIQTV